MYVVTPRKTEESFQDGDDFPSFPGVQLAGSLLDAPGVATTYGVKRFTLMQSLEAWGDPTKTLRPSCNNELTNSHKRTSSG